jgi:hypothetical protein
VSVADELQTLAQRAGLTEAHWRAMVDRVGISETVDKLRADVAKAEAERAQRIAARTATAPAPAVEVPKVDPLKRYKAKQARQAKGRVAGAAGLKIQRALAVDVAGKT